MHRNLIASIIAAAIAGSGGARADSVWLSGSPDMVQKSGRWFIGAGAAGGTYHLPNWNSTTAAVEPISLLPPTVGPASFSTNVSFVAPGGTFGYVLPDGSLPAWIGQSVRLSLTGAYIGGHGSDRTSLLSPSSRTYYTTVDGRFGSALGAGFPVRVGERLQVDHEGFELALRLTSDFPVGSGLVLSPSVGIFGGRTRTAFDYTGNHVVQATGLNFVAHTITERLSAWKGGLDAGLAATWRPWRNGIALTLAGRGGLVWTRASLTASDCFQFALGISQCSTAPGAPLNGVQFATSARDNDSTVGFAGSIHGAISYDGGWVVISVGGFFTWESAVPGVRNPVNTAGAAVLGTQIASPASVRFSSGWKAGGFVMGRIFLP